jgi:tetratricopeptide (TPR) repeat protein
VLGHLPDAVAAFDACLKVDPQHPGCHTGAMWRAKLGGSIAEAVEHARLSLANADKHPEYAERVGEVWESLGEYERALAVYEQGVKDYPQQQSFHMRLAIQYARLGDQDRAEHERAEGGKAAESITLRNRLAIVYAARREFERAEPIFRGILAEHPGEPTTRRSLARMLREMGRTGEADELVEGLAPAVDVPPPAPPTEAKARG